MNKFSFCYIPDLPGKENLTGKLSHRYKLPVNTRFIGILSRFIRYKDINSYHTPEIKYTVILSGPEPQKSILKEKLTNILLQTGERVVFLLGDPLSGSRSESFGNITFFNHLPEDELAGLLNNTETVISRSGYTTVMDLVSLGKKALLIPTPGQPEQEYLAGYLVSKGWFAKLSQKECQMLTKVTIPESCLPGNLTGQSEQLLQEALSELLEEHNK